MVKLSVKEVVGRRSCHQKNKYPSLLCCSRPQTDLSSPVCCPASPTRLFFFHWQVWCLPSCSGMLAQLGAV